MNGSRKRENRQNDGIFMYRSQEHLTRLEEIHMVFVLPIQLMYMICERAYINSLW